MPTKRKGNYKTLSWRVNISEACKKDYSYLNKLTLEDKCYLVGILDGEGCITLKNRVSRSKSEPHKRILCISIANTNKNLMEWLMGKLKGKYYTRDDHTKQHKRGP